MAQMEEIKIVVSRVNLENVDSDFSTLSHFLKQVCHSKCMEMQ